ncbi:MAG: hypothetical protein RMM53_12275 [Bacteroidia bacterium]|nr:aminotransferase class IV [Bacteroidia bacterium]MDW8334982.1 hypothetical protein [Bacteroidia bacterium]
MAGVMRAFMLRHANEAGFEVEIVPVTLRQCAFFEGAMLTNAVVLFRPVLSLDDAEFRLGSDGPWDKIERLLIKHGILSPDERRYA